MLKPILKLLQIMNHLRLNLYHVLLLVMMSFTLTSCEAIADIFQAGVWVGVVVAVVIIGIIIMIVRSVK